MSLGGGSPVKIFQTNAQIISLGIVFGRRINAATTPPPGRQFCSAGGGRRRGCLRAPCFVNSVSSTPLPSHAPRTYVRRSKKPTWSHQVRVHLSEAAGGPNFSQKVANSRRERKAQLTKLTGLEILLYSVVLHVVKTPNYCRTNWIYVSPAPPPNLSKIWKFT